MPYLEHLYCENCGHPHHLNLDFQSTIESYQKDERPSPSINSATLIWDYMVYSCSKCGTKFKLTFRDVELSVRRHLSGMGHKYKLYLDELSKHNDTEESRLSGEFFKKRDKEVKKRISDVYKEG